MLVNSVPSCIDLFKVQPTGYMGEGGDHFLFFTRYVVNDYLHVGGCLHIHMHQYFRALCVSLLCLFSFEEPYLRMYGHAKQLCAHFFHIQGFRVFLIFIYCDQTCINHLF